MSSELEEILDQSDVPDHIKQHVMEDLIADAPINDKYPTVSGLQLYPGEPVFIIKGRDVLAPTATACYAALAMDKKLVKTFYSAVGARRAIEEWQRSNPELVKRPD